MAVKSGKFKMVLALPTKEILFYVQIIIVEIGVFVFDKPVKFVSSFVSWSLVFNFFDISPHKLFKEVIV